MTILTTKRLELLEFTLEDAPFVLELLNSPTWIKFIGDRNIKTLAAAKKYIQEKLIDSYKKYGLGLYLVKRKEDDASIGMVGLVKRETLEDVDVGFGMLPQYAGNGYGYEAAAAVMDYAQHTLKLKRVVAITLPSNDYSIALLKKIGLQFEKMIQIPNDDEELMFFSVDY